MNLYDTSKKQIVGVVSGVVGVILVVILLLASVSSVPANHVGIIFNRISGGIEEESASPGWNFHLPFAEKIYNVSTYTHTILLKPGVDDDDNAFDDTIRTQTRDGQPLTTQADVQYRVESVNAHLVFEQFHSNERNVRQNIQLKLPPIIQRAVEKVTTQYDVVEILGERRAEVQIKIEESIQEELVHYGITLQSFTLVDTDAGDEIEKAIADEAVAQQRIETSKQEQEKQAIENETNRQKIEAEAEQARIRAEGEAEANRLLSESITEELISYKEADARMKHGWITTTGVEGIIVEK